MKKITTNELKKLWFDFFKSKGFVHIPSASLVPDNDATVLFTTAGMHPLVPYLLGEAHPQGDKLCNVQKCVRTNDIDEVGDSSHCTFFEMLGNWTLGKCDKKTMISYSFEFLTDEKYLGIPKSKLAVSVFAGSETAPKDIEAHDAWLSAGMSEDQIYYLPEENNWWALGGGVGPCGPDTEMFYDTGKPKCCDSCSPACDCGKYLEIWNDVFMQYQVAKAGQKATVLPKPNIDTGMGIERTVCVLNGVKSVYDVGVFKTIIDLLEKNANCKYIANPKPFRIIADHVRAGTFMLSDGVIPSNVGQGYVLRRLIRRSINYARNINIKTTLLCDIVELIIEDYNTYYDNLLQNKTKILEALSAETIKFERTIEQGYKEFEKVAESSETQISGIDAFHLYDTYGFPIDLTKELAKERGLEVDIEGYNEAFSKHQELSRMGANQLFKGGLADQSDMSAKYHTATHIMLGGLRKMFGEHIFQKGSNITPERLRFDFNFERKMLPEEIKQLEDFVNETIKKDIPVVKELMTKDDAHKSGAVGIFNDKYGDTVSVYTIEGVDKEFCGGPHAKSTGELGKFKIIKEESSSSGIRRIKAILE